MMTHPAPRRGITTVVLLVAIIALAVTTRAAWGAPHPAVPRLTKPMSLPRLFARYARQQHTISLLEARAGRGTVAWSGESWHISSGVNGAGQANCPSHVAFGAELRITVSGGCGGGVGSTLNRHMGTWSATFRDSRGGGKYVFLLWPQNGSRPEVDFAEDKPTDSQRSLTTGTYHPQPGCQACIHVKLAGDFTKWHTASVVWTASGFTLLMDGKVWAHFPGGGYGGQLHICIHNEPWGSSGSSTLEVSRVSVG